MGIDLILTLYALDIFTICHHLFSIIVKRRGIIVLLLLPMESWFIDVSRF